MNPRHVGLRPVPPGSTIGVIAPAGPAHADAIDAIARLLEGRGATILKH